MNADAEKMSRAFSAGRLGPVEVGILAQDRRGLLDAAHAGVRGGAGGRLGVMPEGRRAILQTHGARARGGIGRGIQNDGDVGECEARAADARALVTLDHRAGERPLLMAEIAEDVGHLHVVLIGSGLTHGRP